MDELRRAMLDAGTPPDEWQAELPFLIEAGQKRVRRRRMIATGVAAAVVAVIGTTAALAGVPGLNKSEPDPAEDRHSSVYVEERLAPAEVERRCNAVLQNARGPKESTWVAGVDPDGRAVPAEESARAVQNVVGRAILLAPRGTHVGDSGGASSDGGAGGEVEPFACMIPEKAMLAVAGDHAGAVDPKDEGAIARACSKFGGYNLVGWDVAASTPNKDDLAAIFMSQNGFAIRCELFQGKVTLEFLNRLADENGQAVLPDDDSGPSDPDRYAGIDLKCRSATNGGIENCISSGVLPGLPNAHVVEVTLPNGSVSRTTTKDGAYAWSFKVEPVGGMRLELPIRLVRPDGAVLWRGRHVNYDGSTGGGGVAVVPAPGARP